MRGHADVVQLLVQRVKHDHVRPRERVGDEAAGQPAVRIVDPDRGLDVAYVVGQFMISV
jgi:hypothetical protein